MEKTIKIRRGTPDDNTLLAEFGRRAFYESFGGDNTPEDMEAYLTVSFGPEIQAEKLADPDVTFLIAEIDQATVGYAQLQFGTTPSAIRGEHPIEIARFYSDKPWIGRGVGPALMSACLDFAEQKECDVIWLDVWEKNPRAIAFYQKWGFEVVGTQLYQVGSDLQHDLLMSRKVKMA